MRVYALWVHQPLRSALLSCHCWFCKDRWVKPIRIIWYNPSFCLNRRSQEKLESLILFLMRGEKCSYFQTVGNEPQDWHGICPKLLTILQHGNYLPLQFKTWNCLQKSDPWIKILQHNHAFHTIRVWAVFSICFSQFVVILVVTWNLTLPPLSGKLKLYSFRFAVSKHQSLVS